MSSPIQWQGRKFTGSPKKLKKKTERYYTKKEKLHAHDPVLLENNIIFGWYFSCRCGTSGPNVDDGKRSIMCDICKTYMHCKCNGLPTAHDKLMVYFMTKRHWICPGCRAGKYKYRAIHWSIPEDNQGESKVRFEENEKLVPCQSQCKQLCPTPGRHRTNTPPILKEPHKFDLGIQLPTPDSFAKQMRRSSITKIAMSIKHHARRSSDIPAIM